MARKIIIKPCPFCAGPPLPWAREEISGKEIFAGYRRNEDEAYVAFVWCHDCGARGPCISESQLAIFEGKSVTIDQLIRLAIHAWNNPHTNASDCYNVENCTYPRTA